MSDQIEITPGNARKDEAFQKWLRTNFLQFMNKKVLIEKYTTYLLKDDRALTNLYSVYADGVSPEAIAATNAPKETKPVVRKP